MKKNIFKSILPVLLCISLVLSIIGRLNAYATISDDFWGEGRVPLWNEVDCRSWFDFKNITYTDDYMCINVKFNETADGINSTVYRTYYFGFNDNSEFTYDENGYIVLSNSEFSVKRTRQGKTWIDSNGVLRVGNTPAGFGNDNALFNISDSVSLRFKEDMSEIYINEDHYTSSDLVYFRYHIGNIENQYQEVQVRFSPSLSGNVSREVSVNGDNALLNELKMTVTNHSDFPIQYTMAIYKANQDETKLRNAQTGDHTTTFYDNDAVFVYYSNSWVYCVPYDTPMANLTPSEYEKQYKPSRYHYIGSGQSDEVTFKYSQINLVEGEEYRVVVTACRNDYGFASECIVNPASNDVLTALKHIDSTTIETVYLSEFIMTQYKDVVYDHSDSSNGILPYDGYNNGIEEAQRYAKMREAKENPDGSIDYESKDYRNDPDYWDKAYNPEKFYKYLNGGKTSDGYDVSGDNNNTNNEVVSKTSNSLSFLSAILNFFPPEIFTVINISLWLSVIIFVIKRF